MIDFHSHIIPGIDDGSQDIAETFNLIKEAQKAGFTKIISTSHYYEGKNTKYIADQKERKTWIDAISMNLENQDISVKLYLGSEVFITYDMLELISEEKASTINGTNYVLFELPFEEKPEFLKDIIFKLIKNNYRPIIAHPERYKFVQKNPNSLIELINSGVLFQANYGSIIGMYGKKAQKTVQLLLKNNLVHFLGSDVHRQNTIYPKIPEILDILHEILPKEEIDELTTVNARLVLENEEIDPRRPIKVKKFFI